MASKYIDIAVIVEPRKHNKLKLVVTNILENLKDVKVQIFHGVRTTIYLYFLTILELVLGRRIYHSTVKSSTHYI